MDYHKLLNIFKGDKIMLDLHLSHMEIRSKQEAKNLKELLIESSEATKEQRVNWVNYKEIAFDLVNIPENKIPSALKLRVQAYKDNVPNLVRQYYMLSERELDESISN